METDLGKLAARLTRRALDHLTVTSRQAKDIMSLHGDLFITESSESTGRWTVQLQLWGTAINLHATSLSFLQKLLEFFRETLNNPVYRDEEIKPGYFRTMPSKSCDLSDCFETPLSITKDGEFDDRYFVRLSTNNDNWVDFSLTGEEVINELEDLLEQAIEDWL